jgi:hypothetical protein
MSIVSQLAHPIREFFTQGRAERTVRAYAPAQHARVRQHVEAATRRERAGRKATDSLAGAMLLRAAVAQYVLAVEAARTPDARLDSLDPASAMPPLPADPARPRAEPTDDARVRAALATRNELYFDELSAEDLERARWALDRAASLLKGRVEARTLASVRGTRWGRVAAVLVVVAYAALLVVRATLMPKDIALGKPVHPSSRPAGPKAAPDGHELVDGDFGTSVGVYTNTEDNPSVVIDLQDSYWIDKVKVYNRLDGWFDDCLPLVAEVSTDGKSWEQIGRREEHFGTDPPWIVDGGGRRATQLRLRVARKSYLALSEVEVFGKKEKR